MDERLKPRRPSLGALVALSVDRLASSERLSLRRCDALEMESFWRAPVAPMGTRKLREGVEVGAEPREPVLLDEARPLGV